MSTDVGRMLEWRHRIIVALLLLTLYVASFGLSALEPLGYLHASGVQDLGHTLVPSLLRLIGEDRSEFVLWLGTLPLELFFVAIFFSVLLWGVGVRLAFCLYTMYLLHWLCRQLTTLVAPDEIIWNFPDWVLTFGSPGERDLWFSGHVANAFIIALATRGRDWRLQSVGWLYLVFQIWLVLATRVHYTIDVVGGLFVAYTFHIVSLKLVGAFHKGDQGAGPELPNSGGTL